MFVLSLFSSVFVCANLGVVRAIRYAESWSLPDGALLATFPMLQYVNRYIHAIQRKLHLVNGFSPIWAPSSAVIATSTPKIIARRVSPDVTKCTLAQALEAVFKRATSTVAVLHTHCSTSKLFCNVYQLHFHSAIHLYGMEIVSPFSCIPRYCASSQCKHSRVRLAQPAHACP